ncbi:HAD family hydrolase [Desulfosediminicola ganghwensis]|uniref:HAD family hydrolase n=1 Tax=Desulfosediminicola ganghwensis TaxID=2569540 RepID=UPI00142ECF31|nr:HAD hydrolase-like protein [Desulfosediminicola ganghwensis]
MFDIDGTLLESTEIDSICFEAAVVSVTKIPIRKDWHSYHNITDSGILNEYFKDNNIQNQENTKLRIKEKFISNLKQALSVNSITEVPGAKILLRNLLCKNNISLSIATGGWLDSAVLKLNSAGISIEEIPIATSDDHYKRIKIMQIAKSRSVGNVNCACTYFGDGVWDKMASQELKYKFIAVGNKVNHSVKVDNFLNLQEIYRLLNI